MRILFAVLCAALSLCVATGSARADRQVYDTPGDQRPAVGDDDEPFATAPHPQAVQTPETALPQYESANALRNVLAWIRDAARRAAASAHAPTTGIRPGGHFPGSDT